MVPGGKIIYVMAWRVMLQRVGARCARCVTAVMARRVILGQARGIGVAQYDFEPSIHGREHETRGNERSQAQHGQDERRRPMATATVPQPICT